MLAFAADRPLIPAAIMFLVGVISVAGRPAFVANGDPTVFIVAGREFVDPRETPTRVKVFSY